MAASEKPLPIIAHIWANRFVLTVDSGGIAKLVFLDLENAHTGVAMTSADLEELGETIQTLIATVRSKKATHQ